MSVKKVVGVQQYSSSTSFVVLLAVMFSHVRRV